MGLTEFCYGRKSIQNTIVYSDGEVQERKVLFSHNTIEAAQRLVEANFEYAIAIDGVKLFRKRKMANLCLPFARYFLRLYSRHPKAAVAAMTVPNSIG